MSYWVFQDPDSGRCTAVDDEGLGFMAVDDGLGELLCEEPVSVMLALHYVSRHGGRFLASGEFSGHVMKRQDEPSEQAHIFRRQSPSSERHEGPA